MERWDDIRLSSTAYQGEELIDHADNVDFNIYINRRNEEMNATMNVHIFC